MIVGVFCRVPSLPYPVKVLLSSISVFKQDKVLSVSCACLHLTPLPVTHPTI